MAAPQDEQWVTRSFHLPQQGSSGRTQFSPARRPKGKRRAYRPTLVYATINRELAEVFAQFYSQDEHRDGDGLIYEVELEDPVLDGDLSTFGNCFEATQGRIVTAGVPVSTPLARLAPVHHEYVAQGAEVDGQRQAEAEKRSVRKKAKAAKASRKQNRRR